MHCHNEKCHNEKCHNESYIGIPTHSTVKSSWNPAWNTVAMTVQPSPESSAGAHTKAVSIKCISISFSVTELTITSVFTGLNLRGSRLLEPYQGNSALLDAGDRELLDTFREKRRAAVRRENSLE